MFAVERCRKPPAALPQGTTTRRAAARLPNRRVQAKACGFPPPLSFCRRQKESDGGAVERKNASRRPRAAGGYGPKLSCPETLQPLPEHGRSLAETPGPCAPC